MEVVTADAATALKDLGDLIAAPNVRVQIAEVAQQRIESISRSLQYLSRRDFQIAFVGQIGIGKSSMIGVLGNLILGDPPRDRSSLTTNSVLAVGSGGTTVCEVRIRAARLDERGTVRLQIDPLSVQEMLREIHIFAADEWARRKGTFQPQADNGVNDVTPREVQRAIRNMTGLAKRTGNGAGSKKLVIDPLDDVIAQHDSPSSLARHLVDKADLYNRIDTDWKYSGEDALWELKRRFGDVNHGRTPTAMLPRQITITVDQPLPGISEGLEVELIDTRGFDGGLAARGDIQHIARDERALIVVCVPFRDAPGDAVKGLLSSMSSSVEFQSAVERVQLVLMDHGDAEGVHGADGDREFGQQLKQDECSRALDVASLGVFAQEGNIATFDTLRDTPGALVGVLDKRLWTMLSRVEERLREQVSDARDFLSNLENARLEIARAEVDKRLQTALKVEFSGSVPMRDPLDGLCDAVEGWPYASQVFATCRRGGCYTGMDAFAAVRAGAARAVGSWIEPSRAAVVVVFKMLHHDSAFSEVMNHVRLREASFQQACVAAVAEYADLVLGDVENAMRGAPVWGRCAAEWGQGSGFKQRVIAHLRSWSRSQGQFQAHNNIESTIDTLMKSLGHTAASPEASARGDSP